MLNEIRIMRSLTNPYVVKLHEVWISQNFYYFIIDLYDKGSLSDIISKLKKNKKERNLKFNLVERQVAKIIQNLLLGLRECEEQNIIHRDLKPDNILVSNLDNLDVHIIDFGLATCSHWNYHIYTKCGTSGYSAPEILLMKSYPPNKITYDCKADVFSLGCIFYEL